MRYILVLWLFILTLKSSVKCKNAWETSRADAKQRAIDLEMREEQASKTSLVSYKKSQMSAAEVEQEATRIENKCHELGTECNVRTLSSIGVFEVEWASSGHPSVNALELDSTKEHGSEDQVIEAYDLPTDPRFGEQWALQDLGNSADINIEEGWNEYLSDAQGGSPDGPSVIVAVIDTGVDYTHPDLADMMWVNTNEIAGNGVDDDGNGIVDDVYGADFITYTLDGYGDPIDRQGHGTHCAGIIAAKENNDEGIAGVASFTQGKVKIMALKGLSDSGSGTNAALLAGLNYAVANGAKISSNSYGGGHMNEAMETVWGDVMRENLDHIYIAAAGNSNELIDDAHRTSQCVINEPNVLCVASSTSSDARSWFSNYGFGYVHVFAPGSSILSTTPDSNYASLSGTSMACPMVSGIAALMYTMRDDLTGFEIRDLLEANVQLKSQYTGLVSSGGLVDVGATIKALKAVDKTGCDDLNCANGGYCTNVAGTPTCHCPSGFIGDTCEQAACESNPCQNGGICVRDGFEGLQCDCLSTSWEGAICDECFGGIDESVCDTCRMNGGTCVWDGCSGYDCDCPSGTGGLNCEFSADSCRTVKTVTSDYASENSWSLGTCEGPGAGEEAYSDYSEYFQACCLDSGVHTLTCKDSYGDGWKWASFNGYLEIDGVRYCEDFNSGYEQITNVTFSGTDVPDNKTCKTIKIRTETWGYENSYAIGDCESTASDLPYDDESDYEDTCCLSPGNYTLECKCSYGDGWHDGYVEIDGIQYCDDFKAGSEQYESVTF